MPPPNTAEWHDMNHEFKPFDNPINWSLIRKVDESRKDGLTYYHNYDEWKQTLKIQHGSIAE